MAENPMYQASFAGQPLSRYRFLVTGGAGFIGSGICEYLLQHDAGEVRVLDNLSEGKLENIEPWMSRPNFRFIEGDITCERTCIEACRGVDYVSHQAALGSVPRSIRTPLATNAANVTGFLNMLDAARNEKVRRFVYASSSSVYGDSPVLPKREDQIGNPLSPYAVTKLVDEIYADVFHRVYGMEVIGLRYFNVFGPRQKPDGPYAAVIPLFMAALLENRSPTINGDGEQSRDFTFVVNAVEANIRAMFTTAREACGRVFNVACGQRYSVNQLYEILAEMSGSGTRPAYRDQREGDIRDSLADISESRRLLGFDPKWDFRGGLRSTWDWFRATHRGESAAPDRAVADRKGSISESDRPIG
jgi:UDP-N-acetylglucosamine/UDP-N-acetylgalactosamine 4-epimerase